MPGGEEDVVPPSPVKKSRQESNRSLLSSQTSRSVISPKPRGSATQSPTSGATVNATPNSIRYGKRPTETPTRMPLAGMKHFVEYISHICNQ